MLGGKKCEQNKSEFSVSHWFVSILAHMHFVCLYLFLLLKVFHGSLKDSIHFVSAFEDLFKYSQVNKNKNFLKIGSKHLLKNDKFSFFNL